MIRKNSLITAGAVVGVLFAGTSAVAANVGLLTPSETSSGTETSVAIPETTTSSVDPQIVDVYIEDPPVTLDTTTVPSQAQVFAVEAAGTVGVEPTATGVSLDGVTAADGWQWSATQPSPTEVQVTFTSAQATYVFSASLALDGTIVAVVDQPIAQVAPAPSAAAPTTARPAATTPPATAPAATAPPAATRTVQTTAPAATTTAPSNGYSAGRDEYEGGESDD